MRYLCGLLLVVLLASPALAQNCPPNDGTLKVDPAKLCFEDAGRSNPLAAPTTYEIGFFLPGANAPFQAPSSVPVATATVIPGTNPVSYQILYSALAAYPIGQVIEARARGVNAAGVSAWSTPTDPFGRLGTPGVQTGVRLGTAP